MSGATDGNLSPVTDLLSDDSYAALADPIKMIVSRKEYMWLSDSEKARLEQDLCEPEPEN